MERNDLAYLAGLIDGEGHFGFSARRRPRQREFKFQFVIQMRMDDVSVLEWVQKSLGFGKVYPAQGRGRKAPLGRFVVTRKTEIRSLIELLRAAPLRSKKKAELELWAEALTLAEQVRFGKGPAIADNEALFRAASEIDRRLKAGRQYAISS